MKKKITTLFLTTIFTVGAVFPMTVFAEETNLALNKTVYCSTEEGTGTDGGATVAESAVDGDMATRWSANGKDESGNWIYSYDNPDWICVDLGAVYDLNKIDLTFEGKGGARSYGYKVYASKDTAPTEGVKEVPAGYTMILDQSANTESTDQAQGQKISSTVDAQGRYVLVQVLSCNQYDATQKWQVASIFELAVYGSAAGNGGANTDNNVPVTSDASNVVMALSVMAVCGVVVLINRRKAFN